jgi:phospholipid transport system substrate-binding protein
MMRTALAGLLLSVGLSGMAHADNPRERVADAVASITERVQQERQRLEQDPAYARQVVREELEGLVDFKRITRLVMSRHFATASREQKYRFLEVFQDSLVNTYASGITLYQGQTISVLPLGEGDVRGDRARVRSEITADDGRVIPVFFSLYQDDQGAWLVENVIVNGLNLGKTFRAQFDQAVEQYGGDLDQVIANWSSELEIEGEKAAANPASADEA